LVRKLQQNEPSLTASTLWAKILARTDDMYVVAEKLKSAFVVMMKAALRASSLNPEEALKMGPLKDPVRVHEKAIDDYAKRFPGSLAEACVADALRCRAECSDGAGMLQLLQKLKDGFEEEVNGVLTRLGLIRCRNKLVSGGDPTHFRNALTNLSVSQGSARIIGEMQVHHGKILSLRSCLQQIGRLVITSDSLWPCLEIPPSLPCSILPTS